MIITKLPEEVTPEELVTHPGWRFAVNVTHARLPGTAGPSLVLRWIDTLEALVEADERQHS